MTHITGAPISLANDQTNMSINLLTTALAPKECNKKYDENRSPFGERGMHCLEMQALNAATQAYTAFLSCNASAQVDRRTFIEVILIHYKGRVDVGQGYSLSNKEELMIMRLYEEISLTKELNKTIKLWDEILGGGETDAIDSERLHNIADVLQVRLMWHKDVVLYEGPKHHEGRAVKRLGSLELNALKFNIVDWGENYDEVASVHRRDSACVSLVGSSVLGKYPRELEQRALQFTEGVKQGSVPADSWSLIQDLQGQLAERVHKGTGLLSVDVWRIWLSMYAPGTALVFLYIGDAYGRVSVEDVMPLVFKVPGVPVQRYVGAFLMHHHFMELQFNATVEDVDVWLEDLPMFVPTLSCFDPKVVNAVF